jgi:hypothetical protein
MTSDLHYTDSTWLKRLAASSSNREARALGWLRSLLVPAHTYEGPWTKSTQEQPHDVKEWIESATREDSKQWWNLLSVTHVYFAFISHHSYIVTLSWRRCDLLIHEPQLMWKGEQVSQHAAYLWMRTHFSVGSNSEDNVRGSSYWFW